MIDSVTTDQSSNLRSRARFNETKGILGGSVDSTSKCRKFIVVNLFLTEIRVRKILEQLLN